MYNFVKDMWNKLTKKEEPVILDPISEVPVSVPEVLVPVPVEIIYVVLNEFEMETMTDDAVTEEDIPVEKKNDVVLDLVPIIEEDVIAIEEDILEEDIDPVVIAIEEDIIEEVAAEDEVKKPKKTKKLKKS
jgi:hypothetical protein